MEDIKDLVSSLTITGMGLLRSPPARKQLARMIYFQTSHTIRSAAFRQTLTRYFVRLTLVYIAGKYFVYRLFLHPANQLPGPSPLLLIPFLGNFKQLLSKDAGVTHREWAMKYGKVFRYFAGGNQPRILVADRDLVKQVLTSEEFQFIKPPETKQILSLFLGNGILVTEGDVHRYQRKMLNPAFGLGALREMVPSMVMPTQQLVNQWWKQCGTSRVEMVVSQGLGLLTLEIIGTAGFGQHFDCIKCPDKNAFSRAYVDLLSGDSPHEALFAMMFPWAHKLPLPRARQVRHDMDLLKKEARKMVISASRRTDLHEKKDLLALMLRQVDDETGKSLTLEELQDQCLTFLAAGHETTSVAVSWALYTLAHHQDIQDDLRKEVKQVLSDLSPEDEQLKTFPTYDDINQLPLLNNVCKEVLRFTPPVPMTNRIAVDDFELHGKRFPKGTRVVICPMVSHFDKEEWGEDCDEFIPYRWDRLPASNISPYVYFPFLAGGRQCIGYKFALIEFKLVLAMLIKNFKFSPKPGFKVRKGLQITLRPLPNMTLMMERAS